MQQIAKLHHITQETAQISHLECVSNALKGGIKWIQLRVKNKPEEEVFEIAKACKELCQVHKATFIINDYLDIAKALDLDGIHLGMTDTSTKIAREVLGVSKIIGGTANTLSDILYHYNNGVSYVGVGPYKFTATKDKLSPILGVDGYNNIIKSLKEQKIHLPLIAIGGIKEQDFQDIFDAGIHGIALASLINLDDNPVEKTERIVTKINE